MNNPNQIIDEKSGFEFTFIEHTGEWIYKSIPFAPKKRAENDKPPYQVCNEIEKHYHDAFDQHLKNVAKDVAKYLGV